MVKKALLWTIIIIGTYWWAGIFHVVLEANHAVAWPHTKGRVVSSSLVINYLPKFIDWGNVSMRWYGADVEYEYSVGHQTYLSNRVAIQDACDRNPKPALKIVDKYRHQSDVQVFYNPVDPKQALLEPTNVGDIFTPLLIGMFFIFLFFFVVSEQSVDVKIPGMRDYLFWGRVYQKQAKYQQAFNEFNKLIELYPKLAQGYKYRGHLYFELGNWPEAIADFNSTILIDPTDPLVYLHRGQAYLEEKEYEKAWNDMDKAKDMGLRVKRRVLERIKKGLSLPLLIAVISTAQISYADWQNDHNNNNVQQQNNHNSHNNSQAHPNGPSPYSNDRRDYRHDHSYVGVNFSLWPDNYYYGDSSYVPPDGIMVSAPIYQPVLINGTTYYMNDGDYYIYNGYGYQAVASPLQPAEIIQPAPFVDNQTTPVSSVSLDSITINIPNGKGGYIAVNLRKSGTGFIGPQGEFYPQFPKVAQLEIIYGKTDANTNKTTSS